MLHYYSKLNLEVNILVGLFCVVTKGQLALSCQVDGVLTPRCWLAARLLLMSSTLPALGPADGSARRLHGGPSLQIPLASLPSRFRPSPRAQQGYLLLTSTPSPPHHLPAISQPLRRACLVKRKENLAPSFS